MSSLKIEGGSTHNHVTPRSFDNRQVEKTVTKLPIVIL